MPSLPRTLGRPRSDAIDHALFETAFQIVGDCGYGALNIGKIATSSGVSKASIYRRYRSRAELCAAALLASVNDAKPIERLGAVERHLVHVFTAVRDRAGPVLQGLMADAQLDDIFRDVFRRRFIYERRAALAEAIKAEYGLLSNLELLLDVAFGVMWYRLLVGHGTLSDHDAFEIAESVRRIAATC